MRRRLLLVTTSLMRGGAEVQVFLLARAMAARGHTVRVVSLRDPEALADELTALGIGVDSLGMRSGVPDPRALWRLATVVRSFRPDLVHSHMVHANLLARVARPLARVPVLVSTAHSFNEGARWRELAYRATDQLCDLSTNVCHAAVDRFVAVRAMPRDRIECVWNGIDLVEFDERLAAGTVARHELGREDAFAWLAVGNLGPAKDYPNLLRAMRLRLDAGEAATLAIVGDGSEADSRVLRRTRDELRLAPDVVRLLGARADVPALMGAADGMVMSSAWEGLPMVLLEAAAARLPIAATRVGGIPEVVDDGATGLLAPAGDPVALAEAMRDVAALAPALRRAWGEAGRARVERDFDIERIVDRWEAIYDRLLTRRPVSGSAPTGPGR